MYNLEQLWDLGVIELSTETSDKVVYKTTKIVKFQDDYVVDSITAIRKYKTLVMLSTTGHHVSMLWNNNEFTVE